MKNNSINSQWLFPLAIIGALTIGFWGAKIIYAPSSIVEKNISEISDNDTIPNTEKRTTLNPAPIVSPYLPESIDFADITIDLTDIELKDRLDKELVINNYWHSNTLFYFKKAARWFPIIEPILEKEGLPDDFKYLAVIESGLANVISPSGAAGFWQFMRGTAGDYNLEVNQFVDERYHLEKATHAACSYLKKAYKHYGDWMLAAASYNMGKAAINNKLEEQQVDNYFDLYLNDETARYVFRILAIKQIFENPEMYGFLIKKEDLYEPYSTAIVECNESIDDLVDFARENNTNYRTIKKLNPWLRGKKLPVKKGIKYEIKIPAN